MARETGNKPANEQAEDKRLADRQASSEASAATRNGIVDAEAGAAATPASKLFGLILAIYLLGLLVGGLYVGMVSPARTVIQNWFGIDDTIGIWMINIYTLFYAALIPITGKLADRHGRKRVFIICVGIFCVGSILCGASSAANSFALLLAGRVVQAAGAGGMIPVANAEIGTSAPADKRGMALGLAAAIVGLSNVLGAAVGSAIIGAAGAENWAVMFYLCIPFALVIIVAGIIVLPASESRAAGRMDVAGSVLFALFVLMLLLGIKDIDFFDFAATIVQPQAWVPLVVAVICLPLFRFAEGRAEDPVFHLEYFHNRPIVVTMIVSFFIGCCIISMVLVPEFAEYAMGDPAGSGGYYLIAIGVTSLFGPPMGGKFIDRWGAKPVLIGGLIVQAAGYLFLALAAAAHPSVALLILGLLIVGLGMGFAMGAPTNYMILENTDPSQATSAIATITLVRQIGTTLAPAILVGFISQGTGMLGYQQMLSCVTVFSLICIVVMCFYHSPNGGRQ